MSGVVRFWLRGSWKHVYARLTMQMVFKYVLSCAKDRGFVLSMEGFVLRQQSDWKAYYYLTPHQKTLKKNRATLDNLLHAEKQAERNWEFNRMPMSYSEFVVFVVVHNYLKQQEEKENGEVPEENNQTVGASEGTVVPLERDGLRKGVDQDSPQEVR